MHHSDEIKPLIIVGTGPAGLTAAIYAARANLKPLVFEGKEPGGQLTLTTEVENFPGFPEGIQGPELINRMREQAKKFGAVFLQEPITNCQLSNSPFQFQSANGNNFQSYSAIISTGASAKFLGLAMEKELTGRGVSTCATCDGFFYKNKIVHVVGGGDTAMEDANFISKFAEKVFLVHRRDKFRASKAMQDRTLKNPKIEVIWNSEVSEILFDQGGVTGLKVTNLLTNKVESRSTHGLFYAIGHTPNTHFLQNQLKLNEQGFILTSQSETNLPGIFACGDVQDPIFRQAITAAGSGCQAAMKAERYLESKGFH